MNKMRIVIKKRRIQEQVYRKFSFEISIRFVNCFFKYISNFYPRLHNDKEQFSLANETRVKHNDMCCKPSKG